MDWGIAYFNGETIGLFIIISLFLRGGGAFRENRWFMGEIFKGLLGAKFNKVIGGFFFHLLFLSLTSYRAWVFSVCVKLTILPSRKDSRSLIAH